MELAMMRAEIEEDQEATMARFLHGLNRDIQDVLELHTYSTIEELIHKAQKVEQQLKRRQSSKKHVAGNSSWKDKKKSDTWQPRTKEEKVEASSKKVPSSPPQKSSSIKCFKCLGKGHIASQCPNKRTMVLLENGDIMSDSSQSPASSSSEGEEEQSQVEAEEGDLLMIRRLMGSMCKEIDGSQRENIFHTRCLVGSKVCALIIDGGSCTNVASTRMVEKLGLHTTPHPRPYKLQWLSESGEIVVNSQVLVPFSIGS